MKLVALFFLFLSIRESTPRSELAVNFPSQNLTIYIYLEQEVKTFEEAKSQCKKLYGIDYHLAFELKSAEVAGDVIQAILNTDITRCAKTSTSLIGNDQPNEICVYDCNR